MKKIVLVRHANWDLAEDKLTDEGREHCVALKSKLGSFAVVLSSPFMRAQETAELLSDMEPVIDERAGILKSPPELSGKVAELRKTNPFGAAGAIISIPELREPLHQQGEALKTLLTETFKRLDDDQQALVVSHDGTIVAIEKVLTGAPFDKIDHTFGELEGLRIDESLDFTRL